MITWRVDRTKLREPFATDVDTLLSEDPAEWVVTQGFRSSDMQQALYDAYQAGGPLAAPPGHSAHEKGLAVDVTLVATINGVAHDNWNYASPDWRRLVAKVLAHPRLHSLDDHGDTDHIEAVGWRSIAQQVSA